VFSRDRLEPDYGLVESFSIHLLTSLPFATIILPVVVREISTSHFSDLGRSLFFSINVITPRSPPPTLLLARVFREKYDLTSYEESER